MSTDVRLLPLISLVAAVTALAPPVLAQETVKPAAPPTVAVPVAADAAVAPAEAAKPEIKVTATKADPKDPDAIVCKWESDTGSRVRKVKVCASRRQWNENGREVAKQYQNQANVQSN